MLQGDAPRRNGARLAVRLTTAGLARIEARADLADVTVSHVVRRMLAYADRHMPDGWNPHP